MQKDIGERIRRMREAQGLSREQVSRLAGLTAERLAAFEQGTEVPSIGMVIKLSRVLGSRMEGMVSARRCDVSWFADTCEPLFQGRRRSRRTRRATARRNRTRPAGTRV